MMKRIYLIAGLAVFAPAILIAGGHKGTLPTMPQHVYDVVANNVLGPRYDRELREHAYTAQYYRNMRENKAAPSVDEINKIIDEANKALDDVNYSSGFSEGLFESIDPVKEPLEKAARKGLYHVTYDIHRLDVQPEPAAVSSNHHGPRGTLREPSAYWRGRVEALSERIGLELVPIGECQQRTCTVSAKW